jgi:hypothetical protein
VHSRLSAVHRQRAAAAAAAADAAGVFGRPLGAAGAAGVAGGAAAPAAAEPLERQLWLQDLAGSCPLEALAGRVPDGIPG